MKRVALIVGVFLLVGVGAFYGWRWWTARVAAVAPPPLDVQHELGLRSQSVPSSGKYAMVYIRENSPLALAGVPVMGDRERKFSINPETNAIFLGLTQEPSIDTAMVMVQETLVGDFLLDSQVVVSPRSTAKLTIRPASMKGRYVGGSQAGQVREMVHNEKRILGDVTAELMSSGALRVGYGQDIKELAPGTNWLVSSTQSSGIATAPSELIIHFHGAWPLKNITYLR